MVARDQRYRWRRRRPVFYGRENQGRVPVKDKALKEKRRRKNC